MPSFSRAQLSRSWGNKEPPPRMKSNREKSHTITSIKSFQLISLSKLYRNSGMNVSGKKSFAVKLKYIEHIFFSARVDIYLHFGVVFEYWKKFISMLFWWCYFLYEKRAMSTWGSWTVMLKWTTTRTRQRWRCAHTNNQKQWTLFMQINLINWIIDRETFVRCCTQFNNEISENSNWISDFALWLNLIVHSVHIQSKTTAEMCIN